jgi:ketosteroid isomerase-like protein
MTAIRSNPVAIVRVLLEAIDGGDLDAIDHVVASDVHFRFGNAEPTDTKANFLAFAGGFLKALAGIRHEVVELWAVDHSTVVATMDVHYTRLDGKHLTLPCCNIFGVRDGQICDYRIYMDATPVTEAG